MAEWLSSLLAEKEVRASISEIGYLLLPRCDMAEIPLKRRKSSIQLTNQKHIAQNHAVGLSYWHATTAENYYKIRFDRVNKIDHYLLMYVIHPKAK